MAAQRVVDRQRRVGRTERDMHLQRAHLLAAGDVAVVGEDRVVALAGVSAPIGAANGCTPAAAGRATPAAISASSRRPAASSAIASSTLAAGAVATSSCAAGSSSLTRPPPRRICAATPVRSSVSGSSSMTSSSSPTVSRLRGVEDAPAARGRSRHREQAERRAVRPPTRPSECRAHRPSSASSARAPQITSAPSRGSWRANPPARSTAAMLSCTASATTWTSKNSVAASPYPSRRSPAP